MKNKIKKYLSDATQLELYVKDKNRDVALPVYLNQLYEFIVVEILGIDAVFVTTAKTVEWPTVPNIKKHVNVIEKFFHAKPVIVFENRAPRNLDLLAKNNISLLK